MELVSQSVSQLVMHSLFSGSVYHKVWDTFTVYSTPGITSLKLQPGSIWVLLLAT